MNALEKLPASLATYSSRDARHETTDDGLSRAVRTLVARARPRRIVETGTGNGLGTTLTLCQALLDNELPLDRFYSIEANPALYAQACDNLAMRELRPRLLHGLSLPRATRSGDNAIDDLLGYALRALEHRPELVLLHPSAGSGENELARAASLIKSPCYFIVRGRMGQMLQNDPRFSLLEISEREGFCMAHFTP